MKWNGPKRARASSPNQQLSQPPTSATSLPTPKPSRLRPRPPWIDGPRPLTRFDHYTTKIVPLGVVGTANLDLLKLRLANIVVTSLNRNEEILLALLVGKESLPFGYSMCSD